MYMTSGEKSAPASVQFDRDAKTGMHGYPRWPYYAHEWTNTVVGAVIGCELMGHAFSEDDMWITPEVASIVTGVPARNLELRCWARHCGMRQAWTWSHIYKVQTEIYLYLPELMVHCQDVLSVHSRHYLNVVRQIFTDNMQRRHKVLKRTRSEFRGLSLASHKLEDILEMSGKIKLKRVFGKAYPYSEMGTMLERGPLGVAYAELTGGYPHVPPR